MKQLAFFSLPESGDKARIALLKDKGLRKHSITAIQDADAFRRLFEGGLLYRCGLLRRSRSYADLLKLLMVEHRIMASPKELTEFLSGIQNDKLPYTEDGKKCFILRKGYDVGGRYYLEYIYHRT